MIKPLAPLHLQIDESNTKQILQNLPYFQIRKYLRKTPNFYPRFLYKYISPDIQDNHLSDYLVESYFWLSSPTVFNDPFDTSAHVINQGNILEKRKRWLEISKKHEPQLSKKQRDVEVSRLMAGDVNKIENIQKSFQKNMGNMGISCLTESPKNLLMWSHYAKQHKGIVLQFEIAQDPATMLHAVKVDYSNEYPIINFAQELSGQLAKGMLRKSFDWEYEKEWRLFIVGGASTYLKFQPKALTGVIFGCRADDDTRLRIKEYINERQQKSLPALNIYNANMHCSKYKLILSRDESK